MNKILQEKISEALSSVLPIAFIVLLLSVTITPLPLDMLALFLVGTVMLILGTAFFSLGTDVAMTPMGEGIGAQMPKTKNLWVVCGITLIIGVLITIAEPDLQVLATQVSTIPNPVLIWTVALGVGVFFVIAVLRTLFQISLSRLLLVFYPLVFILSAFVPNEFVSVAFDSGGVTTGPITVPFIMAMGVGLASIRGDRGSQDDSFGLVALCSIGPILAVLFLGVFYRPTDASYAGTSLLEIVSTRDAAVAFASVFPHYIQEVAVAMVPICAMFFLFQLATRRFKRNELLKIFSGLIYTYLGLVIFLTGVNIGFMPAGQYIGSVLASSAHPFLLVPVGMIMGYFIVAAEPAVHVLNKQVEEVSMGSISQTAMRHGLSIGVAISVGIAMLRVLTGISIFYFLIPGYTISLILTFFVPQMYTGVAFDSGGVASGPMTATFLLPFAMGACEAVGGNLMTDAFGLVAMVAMTPLITIQLLGISSQIQKKIAIRQFQSRMEKADDCILYYDE